MPNNTQHRPCICAAAAVLPDDDGETTLANDDFSSDEDGFFAGEKLGTAEVRETLDRPAALVRLDTLLLGFNVVVLLLLLL